MLLYHGTTSAIATAALNNGLATRRSSGEPSRWPKHPSRPDAIYLTECYALYFAIHVLEVKDGCRLGVVEIDTDRLDQSRLAPDEDVMEQLGRYSGDEVKGTITQRTRWYKRRLHQFCGTDAVIMSLNAMGTCSYFGDIPASAITQVSLIDPRCAARLVSEAMDPTITIMNYVLCGEKYRELTAKAFNAQTDGVTIYHRN